MRGFELWEGDVLLRGGSGGGGMGKMWQVRRGGNRFLGGGGGSHFGVRGVILDGRGVIRAYWMGNRLLSRGGDGGVGRGVVLGMRRGVSLLGTFLNRDRGGVGEEEGKEAMKWGFRVVAALGDGSRRGVGEDPGLKLRVYRSWVQG